MLVDAYIAAMSLIAGGFFVLWHGAIIVALAQAARRTKWRFNPLALLVAATIVAIVIGAMTIGIRDMPAAYQQHSTKKSDNSIKLR
jgi:membrane protein implicated in regulation of membrane protease activity